MIVTDTRGNQVIVLDPGTTTGQGPKQVAAIPLGQPIVPAGTPGAQPGSLPGDAGTGTAPNAAPPQTTTGANPTRGTQPTN